MDKPRYERWRILLDRLAAANKSSVSVALQDGPSGFLRVFAATGEKLC